MLALVTHLTDSPDEAAHFIRDGRLVAFPTETVYGLGANALDASAVRGIYRAKERPPDNPLIVHLAEVFAVAEIAHPVTEPAARLLEAFAPGPLTVVLPKKPEVPDIVSAGLTTVAVRIPSHPIAHQFLGYCGTPVAAPSANRSGRPSPTEWTSVYHDLNGRIDCILKGDRSDVGLESTVVDCTENIPLVLRAGAISLEMLRQVVPETRVATLDAGALARSPGNRYRHYAPDARVVVVEAPPRFPINLRSAYIGLTAPEDPSFFLLVRVCRSVQEYAFELFSFLREADARETEVVFCQAVPESGLGHAVMDRLRRASNG